MYSKADIQLYLAHVGQNIRNKKLKQTNAGAALIQYRFRSAKAVQSGRVNYTLTVIALAAP